MIPSVFDAEEPVWVSTMKFKSKPCWTNQDFASIFLSAAFTFDVLSRNRDTRSTLTGEEFGRITKLYKMLNHPRGELEKDLVGLRIFASAQNKLSPEAHIVDSDAVHRILKFVDELKSVLDEGVKTTSVNLLHMKELCLELYRAGRLFQERPKIKR